MNRSEKSSIGVRPWPVWLYGTIFVGVGVAVAVTWYGAQFIPDWHLRDQEISAKLRQRVLLEQPAKGTVEEAALFLIGGARVLRDPGVVVSVAKPDARGAVVVTVDRPVTDDDSVFRTYDKITMEPVTGQRWAPVRWQTAQQGRGFVGWTPNLTQ